MFKKVNSLVVDPTAKVLNFVSLTYAKFLKSNNHQDAAVDPISLVDLKLMNSKRRVQKILTDNQDFYDFDLNANSYVSDNFTVQDAVGHFIKFLPYMYSNTKRFSNASLSSSFSKFNAVYPQLDLFNPDYVDVCLYSFLHQCFNKIDYYYSHFQNQELLNNGVYMTLNKEKGVLHLDKETEIISLYGGNVEGYFNLRVYTSFSREDSDKDTYDKVRFSRRGSIYDETEISVNVKYTTLQEYLDHYEKFSCMPLSFRSFMVFYKRALFAEFAKPFLLEILRYLKS